MQKYSFYRSSILLLLFLEYVMSADNAYNWGVYKTFFHSVDLCMGSKFKTITENSIEVHYDPLADKTYLNGSYTTKQDGGHLKARIRFWKWSEKSGRFESLVTYNAPSVCDFPLVKKNVLDKCYVINDKCYVKKGTKFIQQLDLEVVGHYFMGERFFHGKFKILMDFFTVKENVTCYMVVIELMDSEKLKEFRKKIAEKADGVTKKPAKSE